MAIWSSVTVNDERLLELIEIPSVTSLCWQRNSINHCDRVPAHLHHVGSAWRQGVQTPDDLSGHQLEVRV